MKYALGNMLNGAGGLNADGLSLDLQFAADKTLTARKGPTPVFTRGTGATQVGDTGLIEYAPENQLLQSETFGTTWTQTNASIASNVAISPDGNTTADKIIENTASAIHGVDQSITFTAIPYTLSFYAKKDGRIWVRAFLSGLASTWFNIDNGNVGTVASGFTASIVDAGNGWYRCSITGTASAGTSTSGVRIATGDGLNTYLGDGTSGIFIWGAQLERHTSARAYIPTTTAAVYGPRFDHDPLTLACKGLLIEEGRTNLALYSGAIVVNTGWIGLQTTAAIDGLGPDGNDAYTITEDTSLASHGIVNTGGTGATNSTTVVSGTTYTGSVFLKKVTGNIDWVQLTMGNVGFGTSQYANFNISTGQLGNSSGFASGTSAKIESYPNGWYRCSFSVTATTSTSSSASVVVYFTNNTNATSRALAYTGSTSTKFLAAMAQLEAGAFPTSYIPTTTAALARSADVCSITGSDFTGFYNNDQGTMVTVASANGFGTTNNAIASIESGINAIFRLFNRFATGNRLSALITSAPTLTPASNYNTANVVYRSAITADATGADFIIDGTQIPDTFTGYVLTADNLKFTGIALSTSNTTISSFRYYRKRLPVSKLQTLTT
jgi:hypothetical protein